MYKIKIKRQEGPKKKPYWQIIEYDGDDAESIASVLRKLNNRNDILDTFGNKVKPIEWECGCLIKKCGACAMRIDGIPKLACSVFLKDCENEITLEPLSKFPIIKDLKVDRDVIFENLKNLDLYLNERSNKKETTEYSYQSAKCLQCGCCLEICPNFNIDENFVGALGAVNSYRILEQENDDDHYKNLSKMYKKNYFNGCGKSLSCHNICPVKIPVEDLITKSNSALIWKRKKRKTK